VYAQWGGIPRQVLQQALDPTLDNALIAAVKGANLKTCLRSVGEISGPDDITHRVMHIAVGPDYIDRQIVFASTFVSEQMALSF
jgi:hypothetical protein